MRWSSRSHALLALAAALCGCSLLVSLDSLRSSDGGGPDAEADAPVDANDAGADSSAPSAFCANVDAANVVLCEDFDETDAATFAGWSAVGTVARDDVAWTSPPFSLTTSTPQQLDAAASAPAAHIRRTFAQPVSTVRASFAARIDQFDTLSSAAYLNQVTITSGGIDVQYRVVAYASQLNFQAHIPSGQDAATQSANFPLTMWTKGTWHHVVVDIDVAATPAALTVTVDGLVAVPDAGVAFAAFGAGQSMDVQAGIYYASTPENGWSVRVDDVLVQAK